MPLPWPVFATWNRIREEDRAALSDVLTELLAHGALIGDAGRDRALFLLAREYQAELVEYLAPLQLELRADPDRPLLQIIPVPGDCGLVERFNKAETLILLTLWRIYHDALMDRPVASVVVTANDLWQRLRLYFETLDLPREAQLREVLGKLRHRRLVRLQWHDDPERFGESQIEILPTVPRVLPFADAAAWEQQAARYQAASEAEAEAEAEAAPDSPTIPPASEPA